MKSNIRVLIADGDKDFRTALSGALQAEEGIEVVGAVADGVAAQESIRKGDIDLLLIDIMLPELDGLSVLRNVADEGHHLGAFCYFCICK
ncbi:MAG: response regulator [Butyricicoccus pullicaecorum]|nr:response regulator [Butyricicoccus pullicaecorum]